MDQFQGATVRTDESNRGFMTHVDYTVEQKNFITELQRCKDWQNRYEALERQMAELVAAERNRRAGAGA